ncbi:MAG: hypothetical protein ABJE95_01600 [Byssovorax sp.]
MQHLPAAWVVDPDDPRAPPQELWDQMTPAERRRVVDSLPTKLDFPRASPPDVWFHGEVLPLPEVSELLARLGDFRTRIEKAERDIEEAGRRAEEAERALAEERQKLAEALAEIDRLKRERS